MTPGIGGFRRPLSLTYGSIFNWFREEHFVDFFDSYPWLFPENAALVIHTENRPTSIYRADF
jgi:hypothetical protein